jgi:hypothetical protein
VPVAELYEGVIIWHMETYESYGETPDGDVFYSKDGQKHLRKGRFSVIDSVHTFNLNKLSMFTYNGKGILEKKSEEVKKEHVGIRSPHIPSHQYVQQNTYAPLEIEVMSDNSEVFHEKTVLHFTKRGSVSFDAKIRIVGRLTSESLVRLQELQAQFGC